MVALSSKLQQIKTLSSDHAVLKKLTTAKSEAIDFLDVSVKAGAVLMSFLDRRRLSKVEASDVYASPLRQDAKIGRIIKKVLPALSDDEIRSAVETIQAFANQVKDEIFVVDGADVYKYYMVPVERIQPGNCSLTGSCYQGKADPEFFELIERNPDRIKLLVIMEAGLLAGRSLFVHGTIRDKPVVFVDNMRGTSTTLAKMRAYYTKMGAMFDSYLSTENSKFEVNDLIPGNFLHHTDRLKWDGKKLFIGGIASTKIHKEQYTLSAKASAEMVKKLWG